MRIVGEPVKVERPGFIRHIAAQPEWGEPVRAVELPQPVKVPSSSAPRGARMLETRFTRQWVWRVGDETFGILLWDVGQRVRPQRYVVDAIGPDGHALFDRPVPLSVASIEACLHFAGFPVEAPYRFA